MEDVLIGDVIEISSAQNNPLSRLSSALSAKASTLRSFQLNQFLRSYSVMSAGSSGLFTLVNSLLLPFILRIKQNRQCFFFSDVLYLLC